MIHSRIIFKIVMMILLTYTFQPIHTMHIAKPLVLGGCGLITAGMSVAVMYGGYHNCSHTGIQKILHAFCNPLIVGLAGLITIYDSVQIVRKNKNTSSKLRKNLSQKLLCVEGMSISKERGSLVWTTTRMIASLVTLYKLVPCIFDNNEEDSSEDAMLNLLGYSFIGMATVCGIYSLYKSFQESKQLYTQYINLNKDVQHDTYKES